MKGIINLKAGIDYTKQPMFLGEDLNIQRYDVQKYPIFQRNFKDQLSQFWRPEEVSLTKDRADFLELNDAQKHIFTTNLKYQTLLDSVQSRAIPFLMHHVTLPELEAAMSAWAMFETLHSYSYTYIIKNVYPEPSKVFDDIMVDEKIVKRAISTTIDYNRLVTGGGNLKENILLTLMAVYILEGIRFYVSFACSYAFAENKLMEGNAKIISFINRDENLHLAITQNILNFMRKDETEGFAKLFEKNKDHMCQMVREAAEEEMEWAKYLFQDGSMLGLNEELLTQFMKWLTNKRMKAIGLPVLFEHQSNPLGWINNWTNSKKVQVAPQESEIESYKIGSIVSDVDEMDFEEI